MQNVTTLLAATPADLASQDSFLEIKQLAVSFASIYSKLLTLLKYFTRHNVNHFYHSMHRWGPQADEWYRAISEGGQSRDLLQQ